VAISDDCTKQGQPDWGATAASPNIECKDGEQSGVVDWGGLTGQIDPTLGVSASLGGLDWGLPLLGISPTFNVGAVLGGPDWGGLADWIDPTIELGGLIGGPDWGEFAPNDEGAHAVSVDAELAARINWIASRFGTGRLWFYDDFEAANIHWDATNTAGASVVLDTATAHNGEQSVKMVTDATNGHYAQIERSMASPPNGVLGLGVFFTFEDENESIQVKLNSQVSNIQYTFGWKYRLADAAMDFWDEDGGWTFLGNVPRFNVAPQGWSYVLMVCDVLNGVYKRFMANANLISETRAGRAETATQNRNETNIQIQLLTEAAAGETAYFDDVFLLYNLPG